MERYANDSYERNVLIVGAGLSGLCLAQALLRDGFDVQVYERDPSAHARRQGYRITLDAHGAAALKRCLPAELFEAARATASSGGDVGYMRFTNQDLGEIFKLTFRRDRGHGQTQLVGQVDRSTLRTIMLSGLGDRVQFGSDVVHVSEDQNGATIRMADGTTSRAALVVGADGIHSVTRERVLPDCPISDTGICGIYGKTPLWTNGAPLVPQALENSGLIAVGDPGTFFFFTTMDFDNDPEGVFERLVPDQRPPKTTDYLMWAFGFPPTALPKNAWELRPDELHRLALKLSKDFHQVLRRFVEEADVEYTILTALSAATRPKRWPASRVTLMGDAVHAMPPTGAHGGNTALRDAALLADMLKTSAERRTPIVNAVQHYQKEMVPYAFREVDSSTATLRRMSGASSLARFVLMRVIPRLRSLSGRRLTLQQYA